MTLLQIFFIISGFIISILAFDIAKKQKFNALHFVVFLLMGSWLLLFSFFPHILDKFWNLFGVQRWADVLVYASIIFLVYISLLLLRKVENTNNDITKFIRELAIENSEKKEIKSKELILIRAYNEWNIIQSTIDELLESNHENILLINDGSTDNTRYKLNKYNNINWITILHHLKNRWWGAALETWFEYIRRYWNIDYVVNFDADGQHDVKDLQDVKKHIHDHPKVDVFIGSRFMWKRTVWMPFWRKVILKLWILFTAFISQIHLSDAHNWFRVFRKSVIDKVHLTIDDMWYASELIDIISAIKIPYKEIPVAIKYTEYSLSKGQKNGNAINIALKIIWNKFFK